MSRAALFDLLFDLADAYGHKWRAIQAHLIACESHIDLDQARVAYDALPWEKHRRRLREMNDQGVIAACKADARAYGKAVKRDSRVGLLAHASGYLGSGAAQAWAVT